MLSVANSLMAANGWLFKRQAGVGGGTGSIDAQVSWDRNGNFTTREDLKQLTRHAVAVSLLASISGLNSRTTFTGSSTE
jgi:hypothetical protein